MREGFVEIFPPVKNIVQDMERRLPRRQAAVIPECRSLR